jgi:heat shock protein HslJ
MVNRKSVRRFAPVVVLCAGALVHAACSDEVTGPSDIVGGAWRLESMELNGADDFVPSDPSRFTVVFNTDGTLGVAADCNQCGGSYTLTDGNMTAGPLVCTLVACPTNRGQEFASIIDGTSSLELEDDELEIEGTEGTLHLTR